MPPPDDRHIVSLVPRDKRLHTYWELNQCSSAACCPAAAAAMQTFLETGNMITIPTNQCADPGQGYDILPDVGTWTGPVDVAALVQAVANGSPGNHVVVSATRPSGNRCGLLEQHYSTWPRLARIVPSRMALATPSQVK